MKIHGYIMSNGDECTVLGDALNSLGMFCNHIYLVDGGLGGGTLNHYPLHTRPLIEWIYDRPESFVGVERDSIDKFHSEWNNIPLTILEHPFADPAHQRNFCLERMAQEPEQPDFIIWIDSDEICSWEFIIGVRKYLEALPSDVTNVTVRWCNLVQDNVHHTPSHFTPLAHARIHRPGVVQWQGSWHEHGAFSGKREFWDVCIIHTRALFRKRLWVQRGHPTISGDMALWGNATCEILPSGVTFAGLLHWPDDEIPINFYADARKYWNSDGSIII